MGSHQPIRKTVVPEIPDKLYFRIGDVARLCEVPAYVLRFWETEFPQLKPNKGGTGQRLYRRRDVEMALRIKSLLYDQGYTIPGARQVFKSEARVKDAGPAPAAEELGTPARGLAERAAAASRPLPVEADAGVRQAKLRTLRDDMQALLSSLSAPVSEVSFPSSPANGAPKVHAMRPRLVSDAADSASGLKLSSARLPLRSGNGTRPFANEDQPDLFSVPLAPLE